MKISICSPVWIDRDAPENKRQPRYEMFLRAINSVFSQTYQDWEWVIADDMSTPSIQEIIDESPLKGDERVKVVRLTEKGGRIKARNTAMSNATGDWMFWFDSDDELSSIYLEGLVHAITTHPEYKIFNFNHLIIDYGYSTHVRNFINMDVQGDSPFGSGNIGAGAFAFSREVYEKIGQIPELGLWQFSEDFLAKYPECKPFFESKEQPGKYHSLGNPWGDDYRYFYEMTRSFKCKYLNWAPYIVHSRFGHRWEGEPEIEGNMGDKPAWNPNNI
jgi:glycosyltransferase involved in cell wall biosynthesis